MLTAENILFGYKDSVNAPVKARLARVTGKSKSTISRWAQDADTIPLKDLRVLCRVQGLSDRQILEIVKGR